MFLWCLLKFIFDFMVFDVISQVRSQQVGRSWRRPPPASPPPPPTPPPPSRLPPSCVRRCPVCPPGVCSAARRSAPLPPRTWSLCLLVHHPGSPNPPSCPLHPVNARATTTWRASPPLHFSPIPAGSGAAVSSLSPSPSSSSTSRTITSVSRARGGETELGG